MDAKLLLINHLNAMVTLHIFAVWPEPVRMYNACMLLCYGLLNITTPAMHALFEVTLVEAQFMLCLQS